MADETKPEQMETEGENPFVELALYTEQPKLEIVSPQGPTAALLLHERMFELAVPHSQQRGLVQLAAFQEADCGH